MNYLSLSFKSTSKKGCVISEDFSLTLKKWISHPESALNVLQIHASAYDSNSFHLLSVLFSALLLIARDGEESLLPLIDEALNDNPSSRLSSIVLRGNLHSVSFRFEHSPSFFSFLLSFSSPFVPILFSDSSSV